jgi:hypothetical protein
LAVAGGNLAVNRQGDEALAREFAGQGFVFAAFSVSGYLLARLS